MPRINSWAGEGTNDGILNSPLLTFSNNTLRLSSSNGRAPYTLEHIPAVKNTGMNLVTLQLKIYSL